MTMRGSYDSDRAVLLGRGRLDETGMFEIPGGVYARLGIHDEGQYLDIDLTADECRQLAAALIQLADRLPARMEVAA